ncbi:MAG TPA: sugar phosphate isomerase/epimerase [Arsenicitalea sp.]|jgi:sugar phosphate isomerase/epimerase|nr:sugar phosphate isomerase/epimerase [Arsenicitalea sp.]
MTYKISYQLYSSRNFPPLAAQLPVLKSFGYDAVEPWLPAYEASARDFRTQIDDAGLACYGFHMPLAGLVNEPNRFIEIAQQLGATYLIPPYVMPEDRRPTPDFWKTLGAQLAAGAEKAAVHGLKVAWHNHDFEFLPLPDGSRPIDHIFSAAGDSVWFEADCAWIVRAGADLAAELSKFADRIAIIQSKDTAPLGTKADGGWTATGDGIIDWPALKPVIARTKADHIVAEHDDPSDWQVFAKRTIDYLRSAGF